MDSIGTQDFTMVKLAIGFVYSSRAASRADICEVTEVSTRFIERPNVANFWQNHFTLIKVFQELFTLAFKQTERS